ncbi:MAG: DUF1016 N-terminal domain-containing protein [Lachnoclostridium sp.]|nr:DUF1016 N-terminal domain-containing protein [Lachnoclostridium sp.]
MGFFGTATSYKPRKNLYTNHFPKDFHRIVAPLARQLSWSHFIALLPLKSDEAFMYYANDAIARRLGKRELRRQISRKAYERKVFILLFQSQTCFLQRRYLSYYSIITTIA